MWTKKYGWKMMERKTTEVSTEGELFLGCTVSGEILTLPRQKTAPHICLTGLTGCGKSLTAYSLLDQMNKEWKCKLFIANDSKNHSFDHKNPNKYFKYNILQKLEIEPQGLPLYFYIPGRNLFIPFKHFLRYPEKFFDIGRSKKRFLKIKKDLQQMKSFSELKSITGMLTNSSSDSKIRDQLNQFKEENLFSVEERNPIIDSLIQGEIPCLITTDLKKESYYPTVFDYWLRTIIECKEKEIIAKNDWIGIFIDELNELQEQCEKTITAVLSGGQNEGLFIFYCCQNFGKIKPRIRTNTRIVYAFQQSDSDITLLDENFNLNKLTKNRIKDQDQFECHILSTKDVVFNLYSSDGEKVIKKRFKGGEPIELYPMPPLSRHRKELESGHIKT